MITEFSPNPFMLHEDVIEMKRTKNIEFFFEKYDCFVSCTGAALIF